ncbi:hypothetical protein ACFQH2_01335 [Natronoarchaeum sp. GCM10025703]|uniref:DUF7554 family protein n=1 Tax=unclassified Natronoarchaeum TaxID=2620183 RepID=UPI00361CE39E
MNDPRGNVEVETLLRIALALLIVVLVLELLSMLIGGLASLFGFLQPVILLGIAALIVLWLLDRL